MLCKVQACIILSFYPFRVHTVISVSTEKEYRMLKSDCQVFIYFTKRIIGTECDYKSSCTFGGSFTVYVFINFFVSLFFVICQHVLPLFALCRTGTPASRKTFTVSVCLSSIPQQALCMGMYPSECTSKVGTPWSIRALAMSALPWNPAPCYILSSEKIRSRISNSDRMHHYF